MILLKIEKFVFLSGRCAEYAISPPGALALIDARSGT